MIVWLWDAPGTTRSASGVSAGLVEAQKAAQGCLDRGQAVIALVEEARLLDGSDVLEAYYQRLGRRWRALRAEDGAVRWDQPVGLPAREVP